MNILFIYIYLLNTHKQIYIDHRYYKGEIERAAIDFQNSERNAAASYVHLVMAALESELGVWPEKTSLQLTVDVVWLAAEPHATGSLSLGLVDPRP